MQSCIDLDTGFNLRCSHKQSYLPQKSSAAPLLHRCTLPKCLAPAVVALRVRTITAHRTTAHHTIGLVRTA